MVKRLLLLFSPFLFVGCAPKKEIVVKKVYIKRECPSFEYNISIPDNYSFGIKQKDGKIVIKKNDFKKLISNYSTLKEELKHIKKAIEEYNKNIERMNDEKY